MEPNSKRWTTVSDSSFDHEREALAFLRRGLRDQDPNRGWSNFEFVTRNGSLYEVDALVVTDAGLFLVEVKSHPGEIGGDGGTWQWAPPDRSCLKTFDNPRLLANRKAKHLADLLGRTNAWRGYRRTHPTAKPPYVQEVIFLSDANLRVTLSPPGRFQVFGRDPAEGEELPPARKSIGGILAALTSLEAGRGGLPAKRIDRPIGDAIAKAVDELGIRERTSRKRVGDYRLGELLEDVEADRDTGITYQDFTATHAALPDVRRRIRIYPIEHNLTAEQRQTADRAARREFTLLHALDHPGILRPIDFTESERGPALVFEHDPDGQPLHRWLTDRAIANRLTVDHRLTLVRLIAEAVRYAHQRGVAHRALCPSAVLVQGDVDDFSLRVTNWHAGARVAAGTTGTMSSATMHAEALSRHDAALYRAPEANQPGNKAMLLDVFSLGALACLLLTGHPPAETAHGLTRLLLEHGHVPADVIDDQIDPGLAEVIALATEADPARRLADVGELLGYLDIAEEAWNLPDAPTEPTPEEARRGDTLGGGRFEVQGRLGSGSTSIALKVEECETGRNAVLKVANHVSHNPRLRAEAAALKKLHHHAIVELFDGPFELDGHVALLLSYAGPNTLAARVADPPGAELAERFGDDLLDAVRYLEQMGVSHRDLKPENIGVACRGNNDELHLVLFDFSLADAPLDRVEAGTQGYVDPFLKLPGRGAWDLHAERYAAAVTLYEMLTGSKPRYGADGAEPAMTTAGPTIDRSLFDPAMAGGLTEFFTKALARATRDRFDTADEMLRAWRRAFEPASQPATPTAHPTATGGADAAPTAEGEPEPLVLPAGANAATPLAGLALSNRAVNALERQEVLTIGDLLAFPLSRIPKLAGVGPKTRREISGAVAQLRHGLDNPADTNEELSLSGGATGGTLIERAAVLLPATKGKNQAALGAVGRGLLGGHEPLNVGWPTQVQLAAVARVTAGRVSQMSTKLKERWRAQPAVVEVGHWLRAELQTTGGVAASVQLAQRLAMVQPDPDPDTEQLEHQRAARALVRAALLTEDTNPQPRWVLRRQGDTMMAALNATALNATALNASTLNASTLVDPPIEDEAHAASAPATRTTAVAEVPDPTGQALADYAAALAAKADELVTEQLVVPRWVLLDALHQVPAPAGTPPLDDARLVELVTGLSTRSAANARLELYRQGLAPVEALRHTRRSFLTAENLTPAAVAAKVHARYPEAAPLPTDLDMLRGMLAEVGVDLRWDAVAGTFSAPRVAESSTGMSSTLTRRHTGVAGGGFTPVEIDEASEFEARLGAAQNHGGLLVLCTEGRHLPRAATELGRLATATVDLDERLLERIRALTADQRPSWETVVAADAAGSGGKGWVPLTKLVDRALTEVTAALLATGGTVLVHNLGLLARYDRMDRIAHWRDALYSGDTNLGALWLLVGSPGSVERPMVDRQVVPVLSGNEWARIPSSWLQNTHRAAVVVEGFLL